MIEDGHEGLIRRCVFSLGLVILHADGAKAYLQVEEYLVPAESAKSLLTRTRMS